MRGRILVFTAALVAAFVVAPAGPAHALVDAQTVMAVSASDSVDAKSVVAFCPRGTVVVGGGARISGGGEPYAHITSLGPLPRVGWFAVGREYSGRTARSWEVTAWAICAQEPPGLDYVYALTTPQSIPWQSVQARCEKGTRLMAGGGGIYGDADGEVILAEARPTVTMDAYHVRGTVDFAGFAGGWTINAYAICAAVESYQAPATSAGNTMNPKAAAASCDHGWRPNSVGFLVYGPDGTVAANDAMFPSAMMGAASAYELPLGQPSGAVWHVASFTICVQ
jgi:hypothetical protein